MSRWRRLPAAAGAAGAAFVLLAGAVSFGLRLSPLRLLPAFPRIRGLDYSPEPFRGVAPLRASFLEDVLGRANLEVLLGPRGSSAPQSHPPPPSQPSPAPSPSPSPRPRLVDPLLPEKRPDLRISMSADRDTAHPGDDIVYTIVVRNVGDGRYEGQYTIEAHVPFGTTYTETADCPPGPPEPPNICIDAPVPGVPVEQIHGVTYSAGSPIEPGAQVIVTYKVTVDATTAPETELSNHAHLIIPPPEPSVTSNTVIVRVVNS